MVPHGFLGILCMLTPILLSTVTPSNAAYPTIIGGTPEQRIALNQAINDGIALARVAAVTFDDNDCADYFARYFPTQNMATEILVKNIFRFIANLDPNVDPQTLTDQEIQQWLNRADQNSYNAGLDSVTISYGDDPRMTPAQLAQLSSTCSQDTGLSGYTVFDSNDPTKSHIAICDSTFQIYYPLKFTENPPPADAAAVPGLGCDGLGNKETDYMSSPGTTFLHELMHCYHFFDNVPDIDRWIPPLVVPGGTENHRISDFSGPNSASGYGAWNAQQIRTRYDPQGFSEALKNADSYAMFAELKYWSFICQIHFDPPTSEGDYYLRLARWLQANPPPPRKAVRRQVTDEDGIIEYPGCYSTEDFIVCY